MGKKTPSYLEFHVGQGRTRKIYNLNCPFPVRIGIKQNSVMLTRVEPFRYLDKKKIIDQAKKNGHEVEVLPVTFSAPEICPKCKEIGVPSFQHKQKPTKSQKIMDEKSKESSESDWWLRYYHKDQKKTCWIHKYVGNLTQFQDKNDEFKSNFISHAIEVIKKEHLEDILQNMKGR